MKKEKKDILFVREYQRVGSFNVKSPLQPMKLQRSCARTEATARFTLDLFSLIFVKPKEEQDHLPCKVMQDKLMHHNDEDSASSKFSYVAETLYSPHEDIAVQMALTHTWPLFQVKVC